MQLSEVKTVCEWLINRHDIDFLDLSLWDVFKQPEEETHQQKTLLQHFLDIDYKEVKLTVAGKITTGSDVHKLLAAGVDFVTIGRAAILHHDYPRRVIADSAFVPIALPVSEAHLKQEGLSDTFVTYMRGWDGFVAP